MIKILKKVGTELIELQAVEKGCWVNIYPPFNSEALEVIAKEHEIPYDFLVDSLDRDEISRYDSEDDVDLIVLNTPIFNDNIIEDESLYLTVPIGIISKDDYIITISPYKNRVIDHFLENRTKTFNPADQQHFVLDLFDRNVYYFLYYLREINRQRNIIEKEIYRSSKNKDLKQVLNLQKSLVYFLTNLRANGLLMMKIKRIDFLKIRHTEDLSDFLDDIIVDNAQASEMADIYTNITNGTMEAFASIISNNLNMVMQRLTAVTIVLMVPTLVASFYGMNVSLPLEHNEHAFFILMLVSVVLSAIVGYFFLKKKWF
ncbi:MAG: magnesium transporter [Planctomycetota bacterium]|jgi:magnesium transporter